MTVLDRFTKLLAYVSARVLALNEPVNPSIMSVAAQENWDYYVRSSWQKRLKFYAKIDPLTQPLGDAKWESILIEAGTLEENFLKQMGFYFTSTGFWRVKDEPMLTSAHTARSMRLSSVETSRSSVPVPVPVPVPASPPDFACLLPAIAKSGRPSEREHRELGLSSSGYWNFIWEKT
ncbi:hypothetical protein ACIA49_20925 [Kribbella sp. NPDC051587]|uniref:hypothetical protein n=1 Tax=Kribbella sp. NPDC051587 TaxID=3364119 RepID=UPI00379CE73D